MLIVTTGVCRGSLLVQNNLEAALGPPEFMFRMLHPQQLVKQNAI